MIDMSLLSFNIPNSPIDSKLRQIDKNVFTAGNSRGDINTLIELGVKTIVSVYPRNHPDMLSLRRFEAKGGIVIYPEIARDSNTYFDGKAFAKQLAELAYHSTVRGKVAICCVRGNFSGGTVGKAYLDLKRKLSKQHKAKLGVAKIVASKPLFVHSRNLRRGRK